MNCYLRSRAGARAPLLAATLLAGFGILALGYLAPARAASPMTFTSVSVDLPAGDQMFADAPGSDAINNNCLACHSAGMVLNQPALTKAEWSGLVAKMIDVYKAPIDPGDVNDIIAYLTKMKVAP